MKILSAQQLYEADQVTLKKGKIASTDLMERAATLCFEWIHNRLQGNAIPIRIFCGTGNNGGDGLVIARHLKQHGYNVFTYIINCSNKRSPDFLTNYERLKEIGVWAEMITCKSELPKISENDMLIDAIFGLGLKRSPEDVLKQTIQFINASKAYILSIDFPSGLFSDRPVIDKAAVVRSYHVLTFQTVKLAFLLPDNREYIHSWEILDIGLDRVYLDKVKTDYSLSIKSELKKLYKFRDNFSHKGHFGHALIIGGSYGKMGAVSLATKAALTIGSGLVSAFIPRCGVEILQISNPEVMVETDAENQLENFKPSTKATVVGVGVGMGTSSETALGFKTFLKTSKLPMVIDADGINLLAKNKTQLTSLPPISILTPHPKEFERLVGPWKDDFEKLKKLKAFSKKHKLIIVLKGLYTAIAYQGKVAFNSSGNPALSTAGSGDVLTGVITGLLAQGYTAINAAMLGVFLHGRTADLAMEKFTYETFTATNCIDYLSNAYIDLLKKDPPIIVPPKEKDEAKQTKPDDQMYI